MCLWVWLGVCVCPWIHRLGWNMHTGTEGLLRPRKMRKPSHTLVESCLKWNVLWWAHHLQTQSCPDVEESSILLVSFMLRRPLSVCPESGERIKSLIVSKFLGYGLSRGVSDKGEEKLGPEGGGSSPFKVQITQQITTASQKMCFDEVEQG